MPIPFRELHNNSNASVSSYETAWSSSFSTRRSLKENSQLDPSRIKDEPDEITDEDVSILENNISMMSVSSPISPSKRTPARKTTGVTPMTPGDRLLQSVKREEDRVLLRQLYAEMFDGSPQPPSKKTEELKNKLKKEPDSDLDDFKENVPPWQVLQEKRNEVEAKQIPKGRSRRIVISSDSENDDDDELKRLRNIPAKPAKETRIYAKHNFVVDDDYESEESSVEDSDDFEEDDYTDEEYRESSPEMEAKSKKTKSSKKCVPSDNEEWFLVSLSDNYSGPRHEDAKVYVKENALRQKKRREALLIRLQDIFTRRIFSQIPEEKLKVVWNARLRKSAGQCRNHSNGNSTVEMSPVVCTTAERVRDTLIHELCHAAVWVVDRLHKEGHGPGWKRWGARFSTSFKSLPFIERCHSYEIEAKFFYVCENDGCDVEIKRQSKSLDTSRKACGKCLGRFILYRHCRRTNTRIRVEDPKLIRKPAVVLRESVVENNPPVSFLNRDYDDFKEFSKDRYWSLTNEGLSHSEVMERMKKEYAELKKTEP